MDASIIILAGGKSSRMRRDKAFVTVGGVSLIERIVARVTRHFREVIIVTNRPEAFAHFHVTVVRDIIPGLGPLSGMHAGLMSSTSYYNLVVACDMPFVSTKLAALMLAEAPGYDVVIAATDDGLQPLHGIYSKNCLPVIERALTQGTKKITDIYPQVIVKVLRADQLAAWEIPSRVFFNVNTPADLERANALAQDED